jgi:hypothetical protein
MTFYYRCPECIQPNNITNYTGPTSERNYHGTCTNCSKTYEAGYIDWYYAKKFGFGKVPTSIASHLCFEFKCDNCEKMNIVHPKPHYHELKERFIEDEADFWKPEEERKTSIGFRVVTGCTEPEQVVCQYCESEYTVTEVKH